MSIEGMPPPPPPPPAYVPPSVPDPVAHYPAIGGTNQPYYAQPVFQRPPKLPLRLFTNTRRILTHCAAFIVFGIIFTALGNLAGLGLRTLLAEDKASDFTLVGNVTCGVGLVIFLGGFWWWWDASMLRNGLPASRRLIQATLLWTIVVTCVGATFMIFILITLLFGNPDALAWMGSFIVTLTVISFAAIPAFFVGERVGGVPGSRPTA